jgi:hypothetical protein
MVSKDELIAELLSDPLLIEKGYLPKKGGKSLNINVKSDSQMVELIKIVVDSKYNDDDDNVTSRKVNQFLNQINSKPKQ